MQYKIPFTHYIFPGLLLFFLSSAIACARQLTVGKYGTPVMEKYAAYRAAVRKDSLQQMIELKTLSPNLRYELRYAGTNNFMHRKMYPENPVHTFLRAPAAKALAAIQAELNINGLGLKIFDAYRPYSVTVQFWELVKDERYVANPAKGSGHNRGLATDLTIINLSTGQELDMGTGFDNFTDTAHHSFTGLPEKVLQNRVQLKNLMEKYGFRPLETEWWHYYWPNDREYEVLDLSFAELLKKIR